MKPNLIIEGRIIGSHIVASGVESARLNRRCSVAPPVAVRPLDHSVHSPLGRVGERHGRDVLRRRRPDSRGSHESGIKIFVVFS